MILHTKLITHKHVCEAEVWITQYFQTGVTILFIKHLLLWGLNTKQMYKHKTNEWCWSNVFTQHESPTQAIFPSLMRLQYQFRKTPAQISDMLDFVSSLPLCCESQMDAMAVKHQEPQRTDLAAAYLTNLISNWLKKFAGQKCKHSPKTWKWQGKEQPELVASLGIVFNSKIILNSPRHKVLPGQSREQWPCPYTGDILWQSESEKYSWSTVT